MRTFETEKPTSKVKLKDGRELLKYDNGFTYCVKSLKGKIEEVSETYYREQLLKNRATKRNTKHV